MLVAELDAFIQRFNVLPDDAVVWECFRKNGNTTKNKHNLNSGINVVSHAVIPLKTNCFFSDFFALLGDYCRSVAVYRI